MEYRHKIFNIENMHTFNGETDSQSNNYEYQGFSITVAVIKYIMQNRHRGWFRLVRQLSQEIVS